ncbi:MAG: gamma carbonic anhydrase family protein [Gammaproteobacteria bacterium]|nr:gamma carbonic anhydrase family protein [Gammaproteobacteria bacterium]
MSIRAFEDSTPILGARVYVDPCAAVIGRVTIGDDASIWPMAVARGDVHTITIGPGTNIQDGATLHVTQANEAHPDGFSLNIGARVTVGHGVILHACTIEDLVLVGMGATVMDGALVRTRTVIGAGTLVPPGKVLESGFLYLGAPARQIRRLTEAELAWLEASAQHYIELKDRYLASAAR